MIGRADYKHSNSGQISSCYPLKLFCKRIDLFFQMKCYLIFFFIGLKYFCGRHFYFFNKVSLLNREKFKLYSHFKLKYYNSYAVF